MTSSLGCCGEVTGASFKPGAPARDHSSSAQEGSDDTTPVDTDAAAELSGDTSVPVSGSPGASDSAVSAGDIDSIAPAPRATSALDAAARQSGSSPSSEAAAADDSGHGGWWALLVGALGPASVALSERRRDDRSSE